MTADAPATADRTPAWVCAPGVLKVPFLSAFLPDYDLRRLPENIWIQDGGTVVTVYAPQDIGEMNRE